MSDAHKDQALTQFENRKKSHIDLALRPENEALGASGFEQIELLHEALPEMDFSDVQLGTNVLGEVLPTPFLVSSMTAGHAASTDLNTRLAMMCEERGWLMGVGSQRRELFDSDARKEWVEVRKRALRVKLLGNLGLSQVIQTPVAKIQELVDTLEAFAMIVHVNALQECMQPEGTPNFAGGLKALTTLSKHLSVPVVVKETGCGFSAATLKRLNETGVKAVDVSGKGGTHWGRIEGKRAEENSTKARLSETFADWGISTVESLLNAQTFQSEKRVLSRVNYEVWASGGLRSGLDAAKSFALGANVAGYAKPILVAALEGQESLARTMELIESELKTALFCTGCKTVNELREKRVWKWRNSTRAT